MGSMRAPDLTEIVAAMIRANRKTMFGGWLPGRIETYDSTLCKASIQLLLLEPRTKENGDVVKEPIAIINEVPVVTMADHYGIRMELALQKGDYVTVFFSSRNVDRWLQRGGMIDPDDERDHDLNDAIAMPGIFDFAHVTKPTAKIKFTQTQVQIGGTAALALASELSALRSAFINHVHPVPGITAGTAATTSSVTATVPAAVSGTAVLKGG